jgi:hypothetical protein
MNTAHKLYCTRQVGQGKDYADRGLGFGEGSKTTYMLYFSAILYYDLETRGTYNSLDSRHLV